MVYLNLDEFVARFADILMIHGDRRVAWRSGKGGSDMAIRVSFRQVSFSWVNGN